MNIWETAILKSVNSVGGTATTREIYTELESGRFIKLSTNDLKITQWGGRPSYQHQVRSHLSNLVQSGDLERVSRGVYLLTSYGKSRVK